MLKITAPNKAATSFAPTALGLVVFFSRVGGLLNCRLWFPPSLWIFAVTWTSNSRSLRHSQHNPREGTIHLGVWCLSKETSYRTSMALRFSTALINTDLVLILARLDTHLNPVAILQQCGAVLLVKVAHRILLDSQQPH
eukprot:FR735125.1.p2 GENE.FR735125.1~~FR735125.1.p2  ORF type:complete len:139 (-),score=7.35 FR735125.1:88-504(-)